MWLGSPVLRFGVLNCQKKSDCYRVGYNGAKGAPGLVSHSQTFLTAEGLESMVAFIGQGLPMRPFDRHVKQPIAVNFLSVTFRQHGNVATITDWCEKLSDVF